MLEINPNFRRGFTFAGWIPQVLPNRNWMYSLPSLGEPNSPESHEYFMFQAFLAGMEHKSVSNPNPSVGCVIVKNNTIISANCCP